MATVLDKGRINLNIKLLKQLRKERGLSQDRLADACAEQRLRVSLSSIKRAECGDKVLYRTASELAKFHNVPITDLFQKHSHMSNCSDETAVLFSTNQTNIAVPEVQTANHLVSVADQFSSKGMPNGNPDLSALLIAVEFQNDNDALLALDQANHITEHHDFSDNCLRLLVNSSSNNIRINNHLISLCLVFQRIVNQKTRLFIQIVKDVESSQKKLNSSSSAFNFLGKSDWKETQEMLNGVAWGKIVFKDEAFSLVL